MNFFNNLPFNEDGGKKKLRYNPNDYAAFGEQADYAYDTGWLPEVQSGGATVYKNRYAPAFKPVMINGKPQGEMKIIGNKNGLFDVVIMKDDGNIQQTIMSGQPFNKVDDYFRNSKSVIQQRMDRAQADPNVQKYNGIAWNQ